MTITIPDDAVELLRGILRDHKWKLEYMQEGEPFQPQELAQTNALLVASKGWVHLYNIAFCGNMSVYAESEEDARAVWEEGNYNLKDWAELDELSLIEENVSNNARGVPKNE